MKSRLEAMKSRAESIGKKLIGEDYGVQGSLRWMNLSGEEADRITPTTRTGKAWAYDLSDSGLEHAKRNAEMVFDQIARIAPDVRRTATAHYDLNGAEIYADANGLTGAQRHAISSVPTPPDTRVVLSSEFVRILSDYPDEEYSEEGI